MTNVNAHTSAEKTAQSSFYSSLHLPVFISANLVAVSLITVAVLHPDAGALFSRIQQWITQHLSWYYLLTVGIFLVTCVFVALSRFGTIKLGPDHAKPEYSDKSWFAMLFSTGMGIGIMFFGVAEPLLHYLMPPLGTPESMSAAKEAMNITFFHWGLHAWAVYGIVGLILAYFSFRMKLPLALRSALYPLIGDRIYGRWGDTIDSFAVMGTIFGVATTLGFGVMQINTGLHYIFPETIEISSTVQIILILLTTACATLSVSLGLDKGIKILSEANLILAFALVVFVFFFGGKAVYLLQSLIQNIGYYFSGLIDKTFNLYSYEATYSVEVKQAVEGWLGGWTLAYWGWWIAWSPFVGMFIAKISRGRTIRNFVGGVLLIPAGFSFFWMTTFGNSAIEMLVNGGAYQLKDILLGPDGSSKALFAFISHFPIADSVQNVVSAEIIRAIISFIAVAMVAVFFITSADSGALVMCMLVNKQGHKIPLWTRIFFGSITGVVAVVLLINGGLSALQTVSTVSALPFSLVVLVGIVGLFKALRIDFGKIEIRQNAQMYIPSYGSAEDDDWRKRIRNLVIYPRRGHIEKFLEAVVLPAFEEVKIELGKQGINASIDELSGDDVRLEVEHGESANFIYRVKARHYEQPNFETVEDASVNTPCSKYFRAEVYLDDGSKGYDIMGYTKDNVINDIVDQYTSHTYFIQNFPAL